MNRVTSSSASFQMMSDLGRAQRALNQIQREIASGKKMQRVSDSPAEAVATLDHRARLRRSEQLDRNADTAGQWLEASDRTNQSVVNQLTSARSLIIQAQSGANDANSRAAIANQLDALRQSLLESANASVLGRPIYSGTSAGASAYDATGAYVGDAGPVKLPVSEGVTMQVSRTGPEVFGTANILDPANGDVFQLMSQMALAVRNGDNAAMAAGLIQTDRALDRVQGVQVELGSRLDQLEKLRSAAKAHDQELKSSISNLEDVDVAEAAITLQIRQMSYQAALQVTAKIVQQSLMDFLR